MFFSNGTTNSTWVLRCVHWQKDNTGCPDENLELALYAKSNSTSQNLVGQQNYLTQLGVSLDKFEIYEAQAGK